MDIDLTTDWCDLSVTQTEWNDMLSRCAGATVFQTFEWYASWWSAFGSHYRLFLLTARENDRLVGIAPLMVVGAQRRYGTITFIGAQNADYQDFLIADDATEPILDFFIEKLLELGLMQRRFDLCNVPVTSANLKRLRVIAGAKRLLSINRNSHCPTLRIRGHEHHVRKMLNKYSMRRPANAFKRLGDVQWRTITDVDEALTLFPVFAAQHADRWRGTTNWSRLQEPEYKRFYQALIRNMLPCGMLDFSLVELDGQPIAFHFGFLYRGRRVWYKPSFSVAHAKKSPGMLLIRYLIEHSLDSGIDELDFSIGDEPFKQRFANSERVNVDVSLFGRRISYEAERLHRRLRLATRRLLSLALP